MSAEEPRGPNPSALDPRAVRRHFARAASTYDSAAVLQREVGARMMERLELVRLTPAAILDAGCGTGEALPELASRYPRARRVALDVALPMLSLARERSQSRRSLIERLLRPIGGAGHDAPWFVCADAGALPFAAGAFGLVWSNLTLQWVSDLGRAIAEMHRVLDVGGLATFTTFGPDTLKELRAAFLGVDALPHVGRFVDMHDVGDMMMGAGFADPVMQMEMMTVTYPDARSLLRDLHAIGATNATAGRRRTLTGRRRFERALAALESMPGRTADGQLPASYEVIYGHAWKSAPRRTAEGHAIVSFEREPRTRR
jgi:malonyl-CoA O-methyltransferase